MEAPISITHRELLLLSPEIRSQVREAATTHRIRNRDQITSSNLLYSLNNDTPIYEPSTDLFALENHHTRSLDTAIAPDTVRPYYESLRTVPKPRSTFLTVGKFLVAVPSISKELPRLKCPLYRNSLKQIWQNLRPIPVP